MVARGKDHIQIKPQQIIQLILIECGFASFERRPQYVTKMHQKVRVNDGRKYSVLNARQPSLWSHCLPRAILVQGACCSTPSSAFVCAIPKNKAKFFVLPELGFHPKRCKRCKRCGTAWSGIPHILAQMEILAFRYPENLFFYRIPYNLSRCNPGRK